MPSAADVASGTESYVWTGSRLIRGWAGHRHSGLFTEGLEPAEDRADHLAELVDGRGFDHLANPGATSQVGMDSRQECSLRAEVPVDGGH